MDLERQMQAKLDSEIGVKLKQFAAMMMGNMKATTFAAMRKEAEQKKAGAAAGKNAKAAALAEMAEKEAKEAAKKAEVEARKAEGRRGSVTAKAAFTAVAAAVSMAKEGAKALLTPRGGAPAAAPSAMEEAPASAADGGAAEGKRGARPRPASASRQRRSR